MTHKGTVTLVTERLVLRRFTMDDAEDVYNRWSGSSENSRFVMKSPHSSVTETKEMLQEYISNYDKPDFYMWGIVYESSLIGFICGNEMNEEIKSICIGYCITKSCCNKGITTEAAKTVIDFFFSLGFNRIFSYHNPLNPASGRVMQKCGMSFEGRIRGGSMLTGEICDCLQYAIIAGDYFNRNDDQTNKTTSNIDTIKRLTDLMFYNLWISMQTVDWNAEICGAPAWRYIYHTLHSADKFFINPTQYTEPSFHVSKLDWPDTSSEIILSRETMYEYYEQVRQKILDFLDGMTDSQLTECPNGKLSRLGLVLSQFRHMYAHIGILNGITIAITNQYPRVLNESGKRPEGLYDVEER
jgi:ribosomal-protein-alanine N-acetyltransferase